MGTKKSELGNRYGRLTVIDVASDKNGHATWKCLCDCGKVTEVTQSNLRRGNSKSCECLGKSRADKLKEKYGTKEENPSPTVPPVVPTSQDTVKNAVPTVVPITSDTVKKTVAPTVTPPTDKPAKIETPVVPSVTDTVKKAVDPPPAETPEKIDKPCSTFSN